MHVGDRIRRSDHVRQHVPQNYFRGIEGRSFQYLSERKTDLLMRERQTGEIDHRAYSRLTPDTTRPRVPIVILGNGNKSLVPFRPPQGRRVIVHAGIAVMLVGILLSTLMTFAPPGAGEALAGGKFFKPSISKVTSMRNDIALISSQAATAAAITQDGYEFNGAGGKYDWAGVQKHFTLPDGTTTEDVSARNTPSQAITPITVQKPAIAAQNIINREGNTGTASTNSTAGISSNTGMIADSSFMNPFTPGQCTYWADYEYHHLTGYAIPWSGDAGAWALNASSYGWVVSSTPRVPSIVVLRSGIQGAGWAGHVAVAEKINADGSVAATNWNVVGWGVFSWKTYYPGYGVSFIWHL